MEWLADEIEKMKDFQDLLIFWAIVSKKTDSKQGDKYWRDLYIVYILRKAMEFHYTYSSFSTVQINQILQRMREYYINPNLTQASFITPRGKESYSCVTEEVSYPDKITTTA